jgi:ribonuclease P protein component
MNESFPKSNRILRRSEFRHVYEKGRKFRASFFNAFVMENGSGEPRLGITTTRKMGNAVTRNRARRLLREVFRKNKRFVPNGIDIVVNAKESIIEVAYREIESDFISFLKRAGNRSESYSDISHSDV